MDYQQRSHEQKHVEKSEASFILASECNDKPKTDSETTTLVSVDNHFHSNPISENCTEDILLLKDSQVMHKDLKIGEPSIIKIKHEDLCSCTKCSLNSTESPSNKLLIQKVISLLPNLTPEKDQEHSSNLSAQETSPILGSSFISRQCETFHASTPDNCHSNITSPEPKKAELVLSVLNRLCSPISEKKSTQTKFHGHNSPFNKKNIEGNVKNSRIRTSKRLFSDICENSSCHYSQSKRNKNFNERKRKSTIIINPDNNDATDPFNEHDISGHTLQAICEATEHIVDNLKSDELISGEFYKEAKIDHSICDNYRNQSVHFENPQTNETPKVIIEIPPKEHKSNDDLVNINKNASLETVDCCNEIMYSFPQLASNASNKVSLNDLLQEVNILEKGNESKIRNSSSNNTYLENSIKNKTNKRDVGSINKETEELPIMPNFTHYVEPGNIKTLNINMKDSVIITDTQFCEVVEAVEMITDLDQTVNNFTCHVSGEVPNESKDIKEGTHISNKCVCNEVNCLKTAHYSVSILVDEENCVKLPHSCFPMADYKNCDRNIENICEETEAKDLQIASCGGTIQIAGESIKTPKYLFHTPSVEENLEYDSLQKANGRIVEVSNESLKRVKYLFDDESVLEEPKINDSQKATAKIVQVINESLKVVERLGSKGNFQRPEMKDFESGNCRSDESLKIATHLLQEEGRPKIERFQTENDNTDEVRDESLKRFTLLYEGNYEIPKSRGFQTASGRSVPVSDESLKKAKELFEEDEIPKIKEFHTASGRVVPVSNESLQRVKEQFVEDGRYNIKGLQTASGRNFPMSDESLKKAKELFDGDKIPTIIEFHTASGRSVPVCDESLKKAKELFDEDEIPKIKGFQTASDRSVPVCYESLKKVKELFDGDEIPKIKDFQTANGYTVEVTDESLGRAKLFVDEGNCEITKSNGFQTASGRSIPVSYKSPKKAEELFDRKEKPKIKEKATCIFVEVTDESKKRTKLLFDGSNCEIPRSNGFQTASGRNIPVSDELLKKAKELFDGDEIPTIKGFHTASGRSVPVCDDSLKKAKELFDGVDIPTIKGFHTASGRNVSLSDESLKKAKELFDGDEIPTIKGFHTASGKSVSLSDESLKKTKELFGGDEVPTIKGFHTASGRSVPVSDESLKKVKELFDGDEIPRIKGFHTASGNNVDVPNESLKRAKLFFDDDNCEIPRGKGFQTASGRNIPVSVESLKKVKELFDGDEIPTIKGCHTASGRSVSVCDESLKKVKELFDGDEILKIKGFQTASGNNVDVPNESLKAKLFFDEGNCEIPRGKGFQTASGRNIPVSVESLKKVKELFDGDEIPTIKGFHTASGRSVSVCDESLKKVKELFDGDEILKIKGFQTASGNNVDVPNESLKAKLFFDEGNCEIPRSKGFQTASGRNIPVSVESLKKVKELFDGDEITTIKGFHTASGRSVSVCDESLKKVKELFDGDEIPTIKGFHTASGRSVPVCDESLKKVKELFDGDEILKIKGFQTASGNNVDVPNESLKAKLFFDEGNYEIPMSKGFLTTSGSSVPVSDESLTRVKELFEYEKPMIKDIASGRTVIVSAESFTKKRRLFDFSEGFQTANGKTVTTSDKSLKSAKRLFDESCCEIPEVSSLQTAIGKTVQVADKSVKRARQLFYSDTDFEPYKVPVNESFPIVGDSIAQVHYISLKKAGNSKIHFSKPVDKSIKSVSDICFNLSNEPDGRGIIRKCLEVTDYTNKVEGEEFYSKNDVTIQEYVKFPKKSKTLFVNNDLCARQDTENCHTSTGEDTANLYSSVILEDDLNLLNQSLNNLENHLKHICNEDYNNDISDKRIVSPSVAREISESMTALIADEESNSSFLLKPCLTSPAISFDRQVRLPSIDCYEEDIHISHEQLSPVLDAYNHLNRMKQVKENAVQSPLQTTQISGNKDGTPVNKTGSFKPPYATSTPNETIARPKIKRLQDAYYTVPFVKQIKTHIESDNVTCNEMVVLNVPEERKKAAEKQDKIIEEKLKTPKSVKPCKGLYLLRKQTEKSMKLKDLKYGCPQLHTVEQLSNLDVKKAVVEISASNALDFKFVAKDYFSANTCSTNVDGIPIGDGALLILDGEGQAGIEEITRAFLASPAVDPSLISVEWVKNHFRWIVLKMASMERMFPELLANRQLSPNNLLLQLKYRYDREIDRCQRPALRKVLEKDESPAKTMVLFVADISNAENNEKGERKELELSDGWYSIKATIDFEMEKLIRKKIVNVGTKLLITGANIINNNDGCHPLEKSPDMRLTVSTNSTRRVQWYTRLGFYYCSPSPVRLHGVLARGGLVPALNVVIARTYPLLFLEKQQEGKSVMRSERAEQIAADNYQLQRQQCAEVIFSQLQHDLECSKSSDKRPVTSLVKQVENNSELYSLLDGVDDVSVFQEILNSDQLNLILDRRQQETSRIQQQLQEKLVEQLDQKMAPRVVRRMLKVRLVDAEKQFVRSALLTVWNPSEDVMSLLIEGNHLVLHNLAASGYSSCGTLQLTAGRQTRYSLEKHCEVHRGTTSFETLRDSDFKAQFSEIDVIGVVLRGWSTSPGNNSKLIYVADSNYNFLGISFSTELKDTGYASIVAPGSLIAASNLHWYSNTISWNLPTAYATELSTFSQHPRQPHLQEALRELRDNIRPLCLETYIDDCVKRLQSLFTYRNSAGSIPITNKAEVMNQYRDRLLHSACIREQNVVTNKSELASSSKLKLNDNTIQTCDTPQNKRVIWLEQFGEPPPLSPLLISTPPGVKRNFRPPLKQSINENR